MKRSICLLLAAMVFCTNSVLADTSNYPDTDYNASSTPESIREYVFNTLSEAKFDRTDDFMSVIDCESRFRQYNVSGGVLISPTTDKGIMQINKLWWKEADRLGYDIDTVEGNLQMGLHIYQTMGISAWVCADILGYN